MNLINGTIELGAGEEIDVCVPAGTTLGDLAKAKGFSLTNSTVVVGGAVGCPTTGLSDGFTVSVLPKSEKQG